MPWSPPIVPPVRNALNDVVGMRQTLETEWARQIYFCAEGCSCLQITGKSTLNGKSVLVLFPDSGSALLLTLNSDLIGQGSELRFPLLCDWLIQSKGKVRQSLRWWPPESLKVMSKSKNLRWQPPERI
uniref:Uncharacterized protein n=1 Tax=Myotis myotis TaxID=51298 RepID=A0A7J7SBZ8_MYOMY|nr:hypothetical protein mMyoMyo1_009470 [Myotis myotis]